MAGPEDLETRVAALEAQVAELAERVRASEQDAAAARVLAGGADRDVAEIRGEIRYFRAAATSSFNAMREDQSDLRRQTDAGFTEIRGRLDAAASGQAQIVELLTTFIAARTGRGAVRARHLRPRDQSAAPRASVYPLAFAC